MPKIDNLLGNTLGEIYLATDQGSNGHVWIEYIVFCFSNAYCVVKVNPDTDEVVTEIRERFRRSKRLIQISPNADHPLFLLLGSKLTWVWTMTNNQGYTDGIQFQLDAKSRHIVQCIAIASRLEINTLKSLVTRIT